MRTLSIAPAFIATSLIATSLIATPALAAPPTDIAVDVITPAAVHVYGTTAYDVLVSNVSNKRARNVELTIVLPETNTSPNVHVMGTLGAIDSSCTQSGTELSCLLGDISGNDAVIVSFDIDLPQASAPLMVEAWATTTSNDNDSSNDYDSDIAPQLNYDVSVEAGDVATNRHCTGQGLTSFYECALYPSSITSHDHQFLAGGALSIIGQPDYSGTWSQPSADSLEFSYTLNGQTVLEFEGYGTNGSCFEGVSTFPGSSWVAPYEVCI